MGSTWHYGWGNVKQGPVSSEELKSLERLGKIQPTDTVWKDGSEKGVQAGRVAGLFNEVEEQVIPDGASAMVGAAANVPLLPVAGGVMVQMPLGETAEPALAAPAIPELPADDLIPENMKLVLIPEDEVYAQRALAAGIQVPALDGSNTPGTEAAPTAAPDAVVEAGGAGGKGPLPGIPKATPARKKRATALAGVVIVSQDGTRVRFKKKCITCGFEDNCLNSMRITTGVVRQQFFCPKCRKRADVTLRGSF